MAFDGYRLVSCIGSGAMGTVYLARDIVLDRPAAIKFIDTSDVQAQQYERFLVEARAVARLQHPNVVSIYRIGEVQGRPYLASEFVQGERLDQLPTPLPNDRALRIGLGLARGLAAAHRRGVLHRDIKPANAMVSDGAEVKLLDFGLAKLVEGTDPVAQEARRAHRPQNRDVSEPILKGSTRFDETQELPLFTAAEQAMGPNLTHQGTVMGTPGYMSPEIWRGEPATFRSDVYSLGAVLYYLCSGRPPHEGKDLMTLRTAVLEDEIQPLESRSVESGLSSIIQRCLSRDPALRFASAEELREALEALMPERRGAVLPEGNPYRGLLAFQAEHRALFFGRDAEIRAILERLRNEAFLLVAGTSGVGKSSLCRAGVLPWICEWGLFDDRRWAAVTLTPGKRPVTALATALAPYLGVEEDTLAERIRENWREVYRQLRKCQGDRGPLLVFIDQLEELVTISDPADAAVMAEVIESLSTLSPSLRLVATVRGDFLVRVACLPGISEEITRALYVLKPLSAENIRQAILGPARAKGVEFESKQMVQALVDSTANAEGALPLLQFALAELWEGRDAARGVIPASALDAAGGVSGALARHADSVLASLPPAQRAASRQILLRLVTLEGTRARQTEENLGGKDPDYQAALAALVRGRLLIATDSADGSAYEVAHEALIGSWPRLKHWLEEDSERRVLLDRLATAIAEWERLGRKNEALWSARQLTEASLLESSGLQPKEKLFLDASRRAVRRRRRLMIAALMGVVLSVAGSLLGMHLRARRQVRAQLEELLQEGSFHLSQARARNAEAERLRGQAFSQFDRQQPKPAEQSWSRAQSLAAEAEALYVQASESLESALMLENGSLQAKGLLADVLYDRALHAERDSKPVATIEFLRRLRVYDDGTRRARWRAPAKLVVETIPPASQIRLQRFEEHTSLNPVLVDDSVLVASTEVERKPGSYLITASAPGRATVVLPFLLRRGTSNKFVLPLPETASMPEGFVYIPAGTFLFGTSSDEGLRKDFFHAAPLHDVETGAYLIAKHETTFGDWLQYLESLPPPERVRRAPSIGTDAFRGALSLRPVTRGWELSVMLANSRHTLLTGDSLRLENRATRRSQDWYQLPVVGVSAKDTEGYLHWLDRSGKVPGARLCTDLEWEKAARGADGREYPHGPHLGPDDANFDETYGNQDLTKGPDEVGSHPESRSPFGVDDMAGNVWEITRSSSADWEYTARGGSYYFGRNAARSDNREKVLPTFKDLTLGFRVCSSVTPK